MNLTQRRAYDRQWRDENRALYRERQVRYAARHADRLRARGRARRRTDPRMRLRDRVTYAIASGRIEKPARCPQCHSTVNRIEAHHADYRSTLRVSFLCSLCHGRTRRMD